jgi:hypothetical protein
MAPTILQGQSPLDLLSELRKRPRLWVRYFHKPSKSFRQRRQRLDHPVLAAGVISVPSDWQYSEDRWAEFKADCLVWLNKTFGEKRVNVIEHLDEKCLHLHVFLVPLEEEDIANVHPGLMALETLKGVGPTPTQRREAYRKAMAKLLDDFHQEVGSRFELVRRHINARRMTRAQWHIWKWYRERARQRLAMTMTREGEISSQLLIDSHIQMPVNIYDAKPLEVGQVAQVLSALVDLNTSSLQLATNKSDNSSRSAPLTTRRSSVPHGFLVSKSKRGEASAHEATDTFEPPPGHSWVRPSHS